jgi:hypothetical protein
VSASLRTCFHHQACSLCSHAAHLSSPTPTDCYSVLSPLRVAAGDTLRPLGWTRLHALPHQPLVAPALPRQHQPRRGSLPCRIAEGFKNCTGEPTLSDSEDAHRIPPGWGGFLVFIDHWTHLRALPHQHPVAPMLPRPLRPRGWTRLHALPHQHPVAPMLPRPLRPRGWTRLHALPGGVAQGSTRPIPPRAHCLHWAQQSTRLTSRIARRLFGVRFGVRLAQNLLIHHAWRAL